MDNRVLTTLEYDKVIEEVAAFCATHIGQEEMKSLQPTNDYEAVVRMLEETDEALDVLRVYGQLPLGGIYDIRPHAKRAQIGGILSATELMEIASTSRASRMIRRFSEQVEEDGEIDLPLLAHYREQLPVVTALEQKINRAIDENGNVLDSASSALRSIRSRRRRAESRVRSQLESYTRGRNASKMLSDAIVTIRNDRFVLPVKAEYRSHYGGVVHDMSASGQTVFVEPDNVVQANNDIRELKMKEREEVQKILRDLSEDVQTQAHDLFILVDLLVHLDIVHAKARYGAANRCVRPIVNDRGYVKLTEARHPLLPIDEAVPNTIEFGDDITTIVITGPNTGGKTVTLKTVGLCTLMAQAGIPIPALDGSEIAVFESVYADIGDEQSIEQSLSTFSSHMVNIVDILKTFTDRSLILFDELGSGTDPQEGAALAISILDEVHGTGARVMATTHYPELKAYGYNRDGVVNASVEFDIETLSPTYRLLVGVPGRSNAFEISERLGLDKKVIDRARTFTGTDSSEVNEMIASLEASRIQAENDAQEMREQLEEAERLRQELAQELEMLEQQEERLVEKARDKANRLVQRAQAESEEVMKELRELRLYARADVKEHELIEMKKRLDAAAPGEKKKKGPKKESTRPLAVGDEVKVLDYGQQGTLLEKLDDGQWIVQIGILKMNIHENRLEYTKPKKEKGAPVATVRRSGPPVKPELDLRGKRYEEAVVETERYLDDALLANYPQVSIIHGKGTFALRDGVRDVLNRHPRVKSFRDGKHGEGGLGVTVAQLK